MTTTTTVEVTDTNPYEGLSLSELLRKAGINALDIEDGEESSSNDLFTLPDGLDGWLYDTLHDVLTEYLCYENPYDEFYGQIVLTDEGVTLKGRGIRLTDEEVG
nr:hypothetical protein 29 [bacterium]